MCVFFPAWGGVQQSSRIWAAEASFGVSEKQGVILLSGQPFSGHPVPGIDRYAHLAISVSIYNRLLFIFIDSFREKTHVSRRNP